MAATTTRTTTRTATTVPRPRPRTARRPAPPAAPLTAQERAELGKARRAEVPRQSHAEYEAGADRPDPISIIEDQSSRRVQELVPIRYARMVESPFRFYRGAAAIMASDLSRTPRSGINAQLCGDAHMLNFRLLASPERNLMFDINDFDETSPGPWEWDVKRLATSLVIAGRANGYTAKQRAAIVSGTVRSYREWMRRFAAMGNLDVWYARADANQIQAEFQKRLPKQGRKTLSDAVSKARTRDSLQAFNKLTQLVDGQPQIVNDPPFLIRADDIASEGDAQRVEKIYADLLQRYSGCLESDRRELLTQYRFADMARKVVGVGSVGTRCWIILMLGRDNQDPLFLQAKEAEESVIAKNTGVPSKYRNFGERVVAGQRLMQAASDIFLGWEHVTGIDNKERDFYVRQLRDWKAIPVAETMVPNGMGWFGQICGGTLARAHARSGDRIAIASYLGSGDAFDRAIVPFAETYADQNERDHAALVQAIRTGRVEAAAVAESSK